MCTSTNKIYHINFNKSSIKFLFNKLTTIIFFNIIHLQVISMLKNINNKLKDNRGWGLAEMLILSGILLLALLLAAYLIYKLYSSF